jgi:hypothetical protein
VTAPLEFRRELIRQANRRGYNATEVQAVLECADWAYTITAQDGEYEVPTTYDAVESLILMWEDSFNVEP